MLEVNVKLQSRGPKKIFLRYVVARAFPLAPFKVLCPVCSAENNLPRQPRLIDQNNDWIFRCRECQQQMLYNPFVDKTKEETIREKEALAQQTSEPEKDHVLNSLMDMIDEGLIRSLE